MSTSSRQSSHRMGIENCTSIFADWCAHKLQWSLVRLFRGSYAWLCHAHESFQGWNSCPWLPLSGSVYGCALSKGTGPILRGWCSVCLLLFIVDFTTSWGNPLSFVVMLMIDAEVSFMESHALSTNLACALCSLCNSPREQRPSSCDQAQF